MLRTCILHREAPVLRIEGGGLTPGSDAFVLTRHGDVNLVVRDVERFPNLTTKRLGSLAEKGLTPGYTSRASCLAHCG